MILTQAKSFMIILTKHGGIVDPKRTRHCVTSRYMSTKPNDVHRNVKPKDLSYCLNVCNFFLKAYCNEICNLMMDK